jgi:hypothetical protein
MKQPRHVSLFVAVLALGVFCASTANAGNEPYPKNQPVPCSLEDNQLSHIGMEVMATTIRFDNDSLDTVDVYWLDYEGNRAHYATLTPGSFYYQGTFVTHPWIVTDELGNCIQMHLAYGTASTATIQ